MTKDAFVAAIAAKPQFIKWAEVPSLLEQIGTIQKWHGIAYINTADGTNTFNVYFMVDAATGEATWQQHDQLEPEKNATETKLKALNVYLKANFPAYYIERFEVENNFAIATVFTLSGSDFVQSRVLVYKQGANPIAHRKIV